MAVQHLRNKRVASKAYLAVVKEAAAIICTDNNHAPIGAKRRGGDDAAIVHFVPHGNRLLGNTPQAHAAVE